MCGIFGEFLFNKSDLIVTEALQKLNILSHRGPDGYGIEYGNRATGKCFVNYCRKDNDEGNFLPIKEGVNYVLGHRRLSVLDLNDNAYQPMQSQDKRYSIVFNGEIYNYIELRIELSQAGCLFSTDHSDTEVLLNAYILWGRKCLQRLRGMFAFAIFDRVKNILFIARDRIGKKPLYYHFDNERFAFASELSPLLTSRQRSWKIDRNALSCYVAFGYVPHPMTIIEGIKKLPPASSFLLNLYSKNITLEEYWDVQIEDQLGVPCEHFIAETDRTLSEAVSIRLRADVPLGAFISGGVDSTLIVKKIHDICPFPFDIFGADFPQPEQSEGRYISAVADRYKQKLHLAMIDNQQTADIQEIIKVFDEPFDGGSSVALFDLFRKVQNGFKVILTGDGGDEFFAGYPRYIDFKNKVSRPNVPGLTLSLAMWMGKYFNNYAVGEKAKSWLHTRQGDFWSRYLCTHSRIDLATLVINQNGYSPEHSEIFTKIRTKIPHPELNPIKALQYLELKTILPCRMLYKLDRFSMRYGVEARSPLLDHQLAELAFSIPSECNISQGTTKAILKKILSPDFSPSFINRKKHGFGNPFSHWFSGPAAVQLFKVLNVPSSTIFNYLDYENLHRCLPQIKQGFRGRDEKILWRFLVLGHYLENLKGCIDG